MYEANLKKVGQSDALTFNLVSGAPAPPEQGQNTFVVQVTHADGSPFQGTLVIPYQGMWMPLHGHGAPNQPIISFDTTQNAFVLSDMNFFMLGLWRVELQAFEATDSGEDRRRHGRRRRSPRRRRQTWPPFTSASERVRVLVWSALWMLGACAPVAAYERGRLAHPTMSTADVAGTAEAHERAVQEGATGGSLGVGGGCGCN